MTNEGTKGGDNDTSSRLSEPPLVKNTEPKPPGAVRPRQSSAPGPIPQLAGYPISLVDESITHDDEVTRRVWLSPNFQKAFSGGNSGGAISKAPNPPPAKKQTIYPPPGPGAVRPPVTTPRFYDIDDDAVTQELRINQIVNMTRSNIGWKKSTSRTSSIPPQPLPTPTAQRSSSIPPSQPGTALVSERPTYLGGLALHKRAREGEAGRTSSIIPAIQLSIRAILARLLGGDFAFPGSGTTIDANRSIFSFLRSAAQESREDPSDGEEILKGINPKLLRAAAQDKIEDPRRTRSDEEWRQEAESAPQTQMESFLNTPYVHRSPSSMPPHIVQEPWSRTPAAMRRGSKSAYRISMGGAPRRAPLNAKGRSGVSLSIAEPPKIHLKGALLKRRGREMLLIRGRAEHPVRVKDIMVFADRKKILYLSSASREDAGFIEFSADVPLENHTNHILVVARHDDDVMGSQSLFVRRDKSHQIDPRAVSPLRSVK